MNTEEILMQVLVMYYSRTGNTKKLAEAIARGVEEIEAVQPVIKNVSEVTKRDFLESDGIIAGSPVYFGSMAAELKTIFDNFVEVRGQMSGKIGAAFATGGHHSGGKETTILSIIQAFLIYGMIVVGDPIDAGGHYGVTSMDEPDPETIKDGIMLGRRVALLVKTLNPEF
jgi:NAD(P)H dehydrogenase (quinone)